VQIGRGVRFGRNIRFNARKVRIGDGCIFMDNLTVDAEEFIVGDFATVYPDCFFPGPGRLEIGHNCWLGKGVILDAQGGASLGNNVGIGAYSQLWSHHQFGDIAYGAAYCHTRPLCLEDEVVVMPGCVVAPVRMRRRSLLLAGAALAADTLENTVYGGVPARSLAEKMPAPFREIEPAETESILRTRIADFCRSSGTPANRIQICTETAREAAPDSLIIDVRTRSYRKHGTRLERRLIRFLLPDIKLLPA
jgi:acetyltransferase-like isoleucine patch superfamily enzyme